jgi:hypothetical protein
MCDMIDQIPGCILAVQDQVCISVQGALFPCSKIPDVLHRRTTSRLLVHGRTREARFRPLMRDMIDQIPRMIMLLPCSNIPSVFHRRSTCSLDTGGACMSKMLIGLDS